MSSNFLKNPDPARSPNRLAWWVVGSVMALAFLVYANSLRNGFAFDDWGIVVDNPAIAELQWCEIWTGSYWPSNGGPPGDILYRPLTICSYLLNHAASPNLVWPYHAANVGLHLLASGMVAVLAWRLFRRQSVALLAGALFAVHPLHTEVVANVVGRAELLAAVWSLAALLVFLPDKPLWDAPDEKRGWWHGWLVALCFLFAILSKETPVLLAPAFVFIDGWRYWVRSRAAANALNAPSPPLPSAHPDPDDYSQSPLQPHAAHPTFFHWAFSRFLRYYLPIGVVLALYFAARIHAVGLMATAAMVHPQVNPLVAAGIPERIFTPFKLLAKYMTMFAWPQVLSSDYSAPSLMPAMYPWQPLALLGELMVLLGVVAAFKQARKNPSLVLSLALFVTAYFLVANVIRIGTIFGERLFYWPSVFVSMWAALGFHWMWDQCKLKSWATRGQWALAAFASLALIALSLRTVLRNPDWQSNEALAFATALDNPQSSKAIGWAGLVLTNEDIMTDGSESKYAPFGEQLLKQAIELCPTQGKSYWELAKYYYRHQRYGDSLVYLAQAAYRDGGQTSVHLALLVTRDDMRRFPPSSYLPAVMDHLQHYPADPSAYLALAIADRAQNKNKEAEADLKHALSLDNYFHEAAAELGMDLLERGDAASAVYYFKQYAKYAWGNAEIRCQLAFALLKLNPALNQNALRDAGRYLDRAMELDPAGHQGKVRELRAQLQRRLASPVAAAPMKMATEKEGKL